MAMLRLMRGLPASGKSTLARAWVAETEPGTRIRLNRDDLRRSLIDPEYRQPVWPVEQRITAVQRQAARDALHAGVSVVVDDMNLRLRYARQWASLAKACGAEFEVVDVDTPVEECRARDALRADADRVGDETICDLHTRFVKDWNGTWPKATPLGSVAGHVVMEPYVPPPGAPEAVLVDIDGTVARHEGIRDPYDTSRYHLDAPDRPVIELVRMLAASGYRIVYCSGREAGFRDATLTWLIEHVGTTAEPQLFMRPTGDTRNDAIVKLELFDKHIRHHYDVRFCLDDRDRVVNAYRGIGLKVLQCEPGAF